MSFCAQSAAESFSVNADLGETALALFGIDHENFKGAARIDIPLDEKCGYAYLTDADIFMTMQITQTQYDGRLKLLHISFKDKNGGLLYEIDTAAYTPERTVLYGEE